MSAKKLIAPTRRAFALGLAVLAVPLLAGCGSSGDATTLLKQTFGGQHTVNSGNLHVGLTITPSGQSTLGGPVTISFGGPFQRHGQGQIPDSNFSIRLAARSTTLSLGILTTASAGYVTLQGTSYQLPPQTLQQLKASFSRLGTSGSSSGQSTLSKLGINPLHWLRNPTVVGKETVGGAPTTHIRANVDVSALLNDLSSFLQKASSASANARVPSNISPSTRSKIASTVKNPTFDLWTGTSDKTLR
ncbi:MAG: hypothetical protein JOZ73_08050, partial [Solirubrobacterales bacterium]|nr:hypothetical protein [Solirubrobacterales bacterium]